MPDNDTHHQKSGKASFDDIYDMEDPRAYFTELGAFDYKAPEHGSRLFSCLIEAKGKARDADDPFNIVDVCCSYGINAALLKYDITLDDLYDRYRSEEAARVSSNELAVSDKAFYAARKKDDHPRVVGVDFAENAVAYGARAGLLDAGFAENLEDEPASDALERAIRRTDLLTVTGGIGYISEKTFDHLLGSMEGAPWVASLALRWVSYDDIAETLSKHGLATEKLDTHTFIQRRFADTEEHEYVIGELEKMGVDTEGKESEGSYHANFYLSRPVEDAARTPIEELLAPVLETSR
ncbi:MAG: hypothetical protein H0U65_08945 [Rubrobacter sp.]|nr:hypothetical protein [Rubrobacter sp.]